jgi:formate dehydrogenase major subunit
MNPEGVARFFARNQMNEGPFPEHYEPMETPLAKNPLSPTQPLSLNNPAARVFPDDRKAFGKPDKFPHAATTYRLTEHFHFWTKHARLNSILQPEQFVEIGASLAEELGIASGDMVKVESNRGYIKAKAVVTKRLKKLQIEGKPFHHVGVPIHWGFKGLTKPGFIANTLTPFVGDGNSQTPESKSFLVRVEKI